MHTHLDLMFDQLDTLVALLQRDTELLRQWVNDNLDGWEQDDLNTLIYHVEALTAMYSDLPDQLPTVDAPDITGDAFNLALRDIREFSAVLLNNSALGSVQHEQLEKIHLTSADLQAIVRELFIQ